MRQEIIQPALSSLHIDSLNAEELLVATCAQESLGGQYLRQVGGPALGIFMMEPFTYHDIWNNFLLPVTETAKLLLTSNRFTKAPPPEEMISNFKYAAQMCRIFYLRIKEPLPDAGDINAIWLYYKKHYNTYEGKATESEFINNYLKYKRS